MVFACIYLNVSQDQTKIFVYECMICSVSRNHCSLKEYQYTSCTDEFLWAIGGIAKPDNLKRTTPAVKSKSGIAFPAVPLRQCFCSCSKERLGCSICGQCCRLGASFAWWTIRRLLMVPLVPRHFSSAVCSHTRQPARLHSFDQHNFDDCNRFIFCSPYVTVDSRQFKI